MNVQIPQALTLIHDENYSIICQESQIGCNLTLFDMDLFVSDSELITDIHYQIEYNSSVNELMITLFLALDNESYVQGFIHQYDTSLFNDTTIDAFFSYSNLFGDPLPFDAQEGQMLHAYVEIETEFGNLVFKIGFRILLPFLSEKR